MTPDHDPIVFVWPGDLHLDRPDGENLRVAHWMAREVSQLVQPDFVQFAGDNVQHARPAEFDLFDQIHSQLTCPWYALVGDHDAHHDPGVNEYRVRVGEPTGATSLRGFRFIRLNTMEFRPLGLTADQVLWLEYQVRLAATHDERIVLFQHHYPFQIMEEFDGPGIAELRRIIATYPITALFAGHTHYGQIANDGRNLYVATRSIGEPEGGSAGYAIVYLHGEDFALTYRTHEQSGPIALITSPRDSLLSIDRRHVVSGRVPCSVRTWSNEGPIVSVRGRVDGGDWFDLRAAAAHDWRGELRGDRLANGEHLFEVEARTANGPQAATDDIRFIVDRSGRYTAWPRVEPTVTTTRFC
jgi:Icc protein